MPGSPAANFEWLIEEFSARLASVFETMAGERPVITPSPASPPAISTSALLWRQPFTALPGCMWISSPEEAWTLAAQNILHAAGIEDADRETLDSTYVETIGQALGGLAQAMSGRLGREVTPSGGEKSAEGGGDKGAGIEWIGLEIAFAAGTARLQAAAEGALLEALLPAIETAARRDNDRAEGSSGEFLDDAASPSKTFDLLLDVEMPVSVSFGRAKVALKDVLKLTTGSIVELNRSLIEPVEVIVNNCVIARGEVVVVEGNFGVRIQQVVSRRERLRTLN